jgi:hypothetical protein
MPRLARRCILRNRLVRQDLKERLKDGITFCQLVASRQHNRRYLVYKAFNRGAPIKSRSTPRHSHSPPHFVPASPLLRQ